MLIVHINKGPKCSKRKTNNCNTFLLPHAFVMPHDTYNAKFPKPQQEQEQQRVCSQRMLISLVSVLCWNARAAWPSWCLLGCLEPLDCDLDFHLWIFNAKADLFSHTYPKGNVTFTSSHAPRVFPSTGNSFSQRLFSMDSRYCSHRRLITPADSACKEVNLWITGRNKTWIMQDVCCGDYTATGRLGVCFTFPRLSRRFSGIIKRVLKQKLQLCHTWLSYP